MDRAPSLAGGLFMALAPLGRRSAPFTRTSGGDRIGSFLTNSITRLPHAAPPA
jgi:hypothetical protein